MGPQGCRSAGATHLLPSKEHPAGDPYVVAKVYKVHEGPVVLKILYMVGGLILILHDQLLSNHLMGVAWVSLFDVEILLLKTKAGEFTEARVHWRRLLFCRHLSLRYRCRCPTSHTFTASWRFPSTRTWNTWMDSTPWRRCTCVETYQAQNVSRV